MRKFSGATGLVPETLRRFGRDRKANFAMTAALVFAAVAGTAGLAVDYSRIYSTRNEMSAALDSAVIATAVELNQRDMTTDEAAAYLTNFMNANLQDTGLRHEIIFKNFAIDRNAEQIDVEVSTELPMTLMRISGWDKMPISVAASSIYGASVTEVAMTFDVTGSMSGNKLSDLKTAAMSGIDKLLGGSSANRDRMRISVIPYSEAVNISALKNRLSKAGAEMDTIENASDDCATERRGFSSPSDAGPQSGEIYRDSRLSVCPRTELQPLTSNRSRLRDAVDDLSAGGYTAGHIGIEWAWYTLSPNWSRAFKKSERPGDYDQDLYKFAVIMTDGEFNTAYLDVRSYEHVNRQQKRSSGRAIDTCTAMKAAGIRIFTIGFALREKTAIDTMRNCASPAKGGNQYFYSATDGDELEEIYNRIAGQIQMVRLAR